MTSKGTYLPTLNASFITVDGNAWSQNNGELVFRPFNRPQSTSNSVYFTLGTPVGAQSTIVIRKYDAVGNLLAEGELYDTAINDIPVNEQVPDPVFSTIRCQGPNPSFFSANVLPGADNTVNLGGAGARWANVWGNNGRFNTVWTDTIQGSAGNVLLGNNLVAVANNSVNLGSATNSFSNLYTYTINPNGNKLAIGTNVAHSNVDISGNLWVYGDVKLSSINGSAVGGGYVTNPLNSNLDCAGFSVVNASNLTASNITGRGLGGIIYTGLDGVGNSLGDIRIVHAFGGATTASFIQSTSNSVPKPIILGSTASNYAQFDVSFTLINSGIIRMHPSIPIIYNSYLMDWSALDMRFVGEFDSNTVRFFQFGNYTNNTLALGWNTVLQVPSQANSGTIPVVMNTGLNVNVPVQTSLLTSPVRQLLYKDSTSQNALYVQGAGNSVQVGGVNAVTSNLTTVTVNETGQGTVLVGTNTQINPSYGYTFESALYSVFCAGLETNQPSYMVDVQMFGDITPFNPGTYSVGTNASPFSNVNAININGPNINGSNINGSNINGSGAGTFGDLVSNGGFRSAVWVLGNTTVAGSYSTRINAPISFPSGNQSILVWDFYGYQNSSYILRVTTGEGNFGEVLLSLGVILSTVAGSITGGSFYISNGQIYYNYSGHGNSGTGFAVLQQIVVTP